MHAMACHATHRFWRIGSVKGVVHTPEEEVIQGGSVCRRRHWGMRDGVVGAATAAQGGRGPAPRPGRLNCVCACVARVLLQPTWTGFTQLQRRSGLSRAWGGSVFGGAPCWLDKAGRGVGEGEEGGAGARGYHKPSAASVRSHMRQPCAAGR